MKQELSEILTDMLNRANSAIDLVEASYAKFTPFDPTKKYSPAELEPYDVLSDRFVRSVEIALKLFQSFEIYHFGESSDTLRDTLNRMAKLDLISSTDLWFQMREVRNRFVHDYLPEEIRDIYDDLTEKFYPELASLKSKLSSIRLS